MSTKGFKILYVYKLSLYYNTGIFNCHSFGVSGIAFKPPAKEALKYVVVVRARRAASGSGSSIRLARLRREVRLRR